MPFATAKEMFPHLDLPAPPTTVAPADMVWARPAEMSYLAETPERRITMLRTSYRYPSDNLGYGYSSFGGLGYAYSSFSGLGQYEIDVLDTLPKKMVALLADEAEDPTFVTEYLIPTLRSENPHGKIIDDISREIYESQMGDLGLGKRKSFFKKIGKSIKKVAKKVGKPVMKVWHKYGNVILGVAGAILAPFTGGASLAAASVLIAAKNMYDSKKAADKAKKEAKKEASALNAQADQAQAETAAQVDKFYADNQAWFLQYDITPDKWAKLTLDQKIELIKAGTEGRLPLASQPTQLTAGQAATQSQQTAAAAANAGIPPSSVAPQGAPGQGYATSGGGAPGTEPMTGETVGPPPEGYQTVAEEEAAVAAKQAPAGNYEVMIEGQSAGKFTSLSDATKFALDNTARGDRFEVMYNGKSTGLRIRVSDGSIESPQGLDDKVRALDHDKMLMIVEQAEKEIEEYKAKKGGGGLPWGLILIGGAAAAAAAA